MTERKIFAEVQAEKLIDDEFKAQSYAGRLKKELKEKVITVAGYGAIGILICIGIAFNFSDVIGEKLKRGKEIFFHRF
ncbi:MAG: hypothetical protein G01um101493_109 [Microgenomates group bacterium Gr01-1014_93]|nr:MAG: hypothetical protein G01um101493_109 [Microgenomates group bacterium Gr01-1014_93]